VIAVLLIVETIAVMIVVETAAPVVTVRNLAVAEAALAGAGVVVVAVDATSAKAAGAICLRPSTLRRKAVTAEMIVGQIVVPIAVMTAEAIAATIAAVAATPIAAASKIAARAVTLTAIAARIPRVLPIPAKMLSCSPANPSPNIAANRRSKLLLLLSNRSVSNRNPNPMNRSPASPVSRLRPARRAVRAVDCPAGC
jgi:hypothetical protein